MSKLFPKWRLAYKESRARRRHPYLFDDALQRARLATLAERTTGKSVAIVGNAESIFFRHDGDQIDRHDIVLRINRGFIRDATAQGKRTDVVCLGTKVSLPEVTQAFPEAVTIFVSPYRSNMAADMMANSRELICYPFAEWRELCGRLNGTYPSAGLKAIDICRNMLTTGSVALYGFDWKATRTFYRPELRRGLHAWEAERALIEGWAAEGWLTLPPTD